MLSIIFFLVNIFSLLPTITLGNPLPLPPLSQTPQTSPIPAAENANLQALDYDNMDTAQDYDQLWSTVSGLLSDDIPEKNLFFDMCVLKELGYEDTKNQIQKLRLGQIGSSHRQKLKAATMHCVDGLNLFAARKLDRQEWQDIIEGWN